MKKKLVSLFLVGAMTAGMVAGCGNSGNGNNAAAGNNNGGAADTDNAVEATETADEESTFDGTYSNKQVILGESSETSGDITPFWANGSSDYDAFKLVSQGMEPIVRDQTGKWIENPTVLEKLETTDNEDGSKTYTITIKDGLTFSDGSPITAENYVFSNMLCASNEFLTDLEASEASSGNYQYYKGFDVYSAGESDTFEGVHLIDEKTYSVTIDAAYVPYYYGQTLLSTNPESMALWVPEDVTMEETENGVKFSDNFTAEYIGDTVDAARWNYNISSGAYMLTGYDENSYTYTLTKNPNFPGNFEGQTANIETVLVKYTPQDTMMDQLKTGAVDILYQVADGDQIEQGLDMVDEGDFDYLTYGRAGYGMLSFKCNQGPTQFVEVRHAVAYLLDRVTFAQTFTGGHGLVVNGPYGSQQWMAEEYAEEIDGLNSYTYSLDSAIAELEAGGWVYNEDGSDYSGSGIRYKQLDDGTYMPLIIEWFSSENNSVSDLLVTSLQQNPDVEAAGMKINQTVGSFTDLLTYYYDNSEENPYQMFNLATGFGNPYDMAYMYEPGSGSNINAVPGEDGQKLYDLCVAMNQTEEGDDEAYAENWFNFISFWNELLPEVPLYSNDYHDFYTSKLHDFEEDGYNWDVTQAILYANME